MVEESLTPAAVNEMVALAFPGSQVRCRELGDGYAVASRMSGADDIRPGGYISGPSQFAVADSALWFLVFTALGRIEPMALTSELSIRYLRPAVGEELYAKAELAALNRRSVVGSVVVWTADPLKPTAIAQGTYSLPLPR